MLDVVIRELTAKDNNKQTTSKDVLAWAKRVEMQQAQAAMLNDITESQKFDKIKMAQNQKAARIGKQHTQHIKNGCADIVEGVMHPDSAQPMENVCWMWENGPLQEGMQE